MMASLKVPLVLTYCLFTLLNVLTIGPAVNEKLAQMTWGKTLTTVITNIATCITETV